MRWEFITEFICDIRHKGPPSRSNSTNTPCIIMKAKLNYNVFLVISKPIIFCRRWITLNRIKSRSAIIRHLSCFHYLRNYAITKHLLILQLNDGKPHEIAHGTAEVVERKH